MEIIRSSHSAWLTFDEIDVSEHARAYNATDVMALANSIRAIGLLTPLTVIKRGEGYLLVAGRHRLEALRLLHADKVPVRIVDFDDVEARLWTISENLHRTELTVLDRSEQIAEWIRLTAERVSRQLVAKPQGGRPEGGVRAAARELDISEPDARRATKISAIAPKAKEAMRAAKLDNNQAAALKVAAEPAAKQVEAVAAIAKSKSQGPKAESEARTRERERARPLHSLENLSAGEFARWIKITTPDNLTRIIRMLEMTAAILRDAT